MPCDNYVLTGDIGSPYGGLLAYPSYYFNNMQPQEDKLKSSIFGVNIDTLIIKNIIVGYFCLRKFDPTYSGQQTELIKDYKEKQPQQFNYFETSKKSHIKQNEYVINSETYEQ